MTCPECGQPIEGLGKCWTDGCGYDARDEPKVAKQVGESMGEHRPPNEVRMTLPWSCLASDNLKTRRPGPSEAKYRSKKEAAEARLVAQAGPGRPLIPEGPVRVALAFHPPDRRRRDPLNYAKMLFDAMNEIVWGDDSQAIDGAWSMHPPDGDEPRCEIAVFRIQERAA